MHVTSTRIGSAAVSRFAIAEGEGLSVSSRKGSKITQGSKKRKFDEMVKASEKKIYKRRKREESEETGLPGIS